jgi:pre-60S factor REI1
MTTTSDLFTCVTCQVGFKEHESQRDHYKTDWHRYNLKRKVADMPPVGYEDFTARAKLQRDQEENVVAAEEMFCKACSKHFTNENSFANHKQSKKHKDLERAFVTAIQTKVGVESPEQSENLIKKFLNVKSDHTEKRLAQMNEYLKKCEREAAEDEAEEDAMQDVVEEAEEQTEDQLNWEDIESEDEEGQATTLDRGIPVTDCLFCEAKFGSVEDKCEHMALKHSFYIPDMAHVSDLEGLVRHLGVKMGVYHVCLWCSSKCYRDRQSVARHMSDKGHQKMRFEGETLLEYADFYTFEDDESAADDDADFEMLDESAFFQGSDGSLALYTREGQSNIIKENDSEFELVLPSGARLGHRSLHRYYRQSFGHRNLEQKALANFTLKDKYLAISMGQNYSGKLLGPFLFF